MRRRVDIDDEKTVCHTDKMLAPPSDADGRKFLSCSVHLPSAQISI